MVVLTLTWNLTLGKIRIFHSRLPFLSFPRTQAYLFMLCGCAYTRGTCESLIWKRVCEKSVSSIFRFFGHTLTTNWAPFTVQGYQTNKISLSAFKKKRNMKILGFSPLTNNFHALRQTRDRTVVIVDLLIGFLDRTLPKRTSSSELGVGCTRGFTSNESPTAKMDMVFPSLLQNFVSLHLRERSSCGLKNSS